MTFILSIILIAGCVAGAFCDWRLLDDSKEGRNWFLSWAIRGIVAPTLVWMFFNSGICTSVPSFVYQLDLIKPFGAWLTTFLMVSSVGLLIIGSYWSALTCGWMLVIIGRRAQNRRDFGAIVGVWSFFLSPLVWLTLRWMGWGGAGVAGMVWGFPLVYFATRSLGSQIERPPMYSRAIAKMQLGKYEDAESEVIRELEKHENDFNGWLMLAELYAVHFNDLPAADRTVHELCHDPEVTVSQISVALHRLADWHLNPGQDPVAARRALEEICQKLPGTHLDRMARIRIDHLPRSKQELLNQKHAKTIRMPALQSTRDPMSEVPAPKLTREQAAAQANLLVEKLRKNPNDIASREALAKVFAEQLDKVDLALEQMELLLAMPQKALRKGAEWLSLMANWQIRYKHDEKAAAGFLERLLRDYPQTVEAFTAQRRLNFIRRETTVPRLRTHLSSSDL